MNDVLTLKINRIECQRKRNERTEAFQQTLADIFRQYQMLLDDCRELEEKYEALQINSEKSTHVTMDDESKSCHCSAAALGNGKVTAADEPASADAAKDQETDGDFESVRKKDVAEKVSNVNYDQSYQIFSQDFCTQGLEESFPKHNEVPLKEIQNVTPTRSKSPIFGSKKGKVTRTLSTPMISPSVSDKSVIILLDSPQASTELDTFTIADTQAFLTPDKANAADTPKAVKKWGLSTIRNVNTDLILGSKKKLKQSKIILTTEKVTDLSTCDDASDKDKASKTLDLAEENSTQIDTSCIEDSLIQVSPMWNKGLSRIREKIARTNKSSETLQKKFGKNYAAIVKKADQTGTEAMVLEPILASTQYGDSRSHSRALETNKSNRKYTEVVRKCDYFGQTDTQTTIFHPVVDSTRYSDPTSCPKALEMEKMEKIVDRLGPEEERNHDSQIIDDTLFVENVTSGDNWSQKKRSIETSNLRTRSLSLKKNNKKKSLSNPGETEGENLPRKKLARTHYDNPVKRRAASPTYMYKRSPVRKKADRILLNGWSCLECQNYYEALDLSEEELQKRKNMCSRHRSKFKEQKNTQKDYWKPDFTSSFHSTIWGDE